MTCARSLSTFGRMFVIAIFLLWLPLSVRAAEVIHSYASDIVVNESGMIEVTETISVRAEGRSIRRGIFRDMPLVYVNDDGSQMRPAFRILSVQRDGQNEPFHTENIRDGIRIYVGDADVFLPTGDYTYTITYTMERMVRRFESHDEIYWNVTGNFWTFPINKAVARVTLPDNANINGLAVYTGRFGEDGEDATINQTSDNEAIFRTTRSLDAREGMSVAVLFDEGVIAEVSTWQKFLYYLSDHRSTIFPSLAALIVLAYFYFAWDAVGRDPKKGTIIPLFYPPEGMSPALVHFVHSMGWKKQGWTAFSAALVSLATKGQISIDKDGKKTNFTHLSQSRDDLPPGEAVIDSYIASKGTLKVNKSNGKTIASKKSKFLKAVVGENQRAYFKNNTLYTIGGVVLSVVLLIGMAILDILNPEYLIIALVIGVFLGIMSGVLSQFSIASGLSRFVMFAVFGIMFANMGIGVSSFLTSLRPEIGLVAVVTIAIINIVFAFLMRAPSIMGRKLMDQIEGFKLYLETAEKERLKFVEEPDFSIKRFEQILPYAVALGVEENWGKRLEGELSRNAISDTNGNYHPNWYHGTNFSRSNLGQDIAGIASGMSAAMISAQPTSSSSSGGGGGGFSGGGGGGGGGGGW